MKTMKQPAKKSKASQPPTRRKMKPVVEPGKSASAALVVVYISNGPYAAEIAKGKLESEGIDAMIQSEAQSTFPVTVDTLGEVKVLVRAEDEQKARRVLK